MATTVSVLMPAYNAASHIREAIRSVLVQSFQDFELIVVNDGSSDATSAIVAAMGDPRIRLVDSTTNIGLVAALNLGLSQCSGTFIARMDADDISAVNRLAHQVQYLVAHPETGLIGGAIRYLHETQLGETVKFPTRHQDIAAHMLFYCPLAHPAVMFRREMLALWSPFYDAAYAHAEDYHLWARLLQHAHAANLAETVLDYRVHDKQVSAARKSIQYEVSRRVRAEMLEAAGVGACAEDLALHESATLEQSSGGWRYLDALAKWFERIEAANSTTFYWESAALNRVLTDRFAAAVRRIAPLQAVQPRSRHLNAYLAGCNYCGDDPLRYVLRHAKRLLRSSLKGWSA